MWALRSGRLTPGDTKKRIVYFTLANELHLGPEVVDRMDNTLVESFIYLLGEIKKEQERKKQIKR